MVGNRDLLVPGIESIRLHADGDIKVKPDLHAKPHREIAAGLQLAVGGPLHEFHEFDLGCICARAQFAAFDVVGFSPFLRPFPPRLVEFVPQHFEAGEPRQQRRALVTKFFKIPLACTVRIGLECFERQPQRAPFQLSDADIVDGTARSQPGDVFTARGESAALNFRQLFDVDIECIQEQPAVRRIRAAVGRTVVEQCVQRIEADAVRPQMARKFDQACEVSEVPDAPVARRADAIELDGQQPAAVEIAVESPWRSHDQRRFFRE
jgi:hypothetical protein